MKGRDIFIHLCEAPDPETALRALDRKALRRLADWLDALAAAGGFAELAAGLVLIECARRWREKHKEDEPDSLAAALAEGREDV
jgi:hypothetical protein